MSYFDQSMLARDGDFNLRIAACVSNETEAVNPLQWASEHQWAIAAAPGFADAYSSAVAADVVNPGRDTAVISDEQILSAVQTRLATP